MDAFFLLEEPARHSSLRLLAQSFGCTYICLWSYAFVLSPTPSDRLIFLDGFFDDDSGRPSTSSGRSLASTLFAAYGQLIVPLDNDSLRFPGFAFRNNRPYIELKEAQLRALSFHQTQRDFYREAKIKTAVFMGCRSGEIELGLSNVDSQINIEMRLKEFFWEDFSRTQQQSDPFLDLPQPSSSSSSLRSLSTETTDSSLIFSIPSSYHAQTEAPAAAAWFLPISTAGTATEPHQQAMQALSHIRSAHLPTLESEESAMMRNILAVLTSQSSSSTSSTPSQYHMFQPSQQQNLPYGSTSYRPNQRASAFKRFISAIGPRETETRERFRKPSMLKRAILYYTRLNFTRQEYRLRSGRTTTTQLQHMISERRRREKQNENFQALRSLLPPETKKDRASVLTTAREQLSLLQEQVAELRKRNQLLEAQLLSEIKEVTEEVAGGGASSSERHDVRIIPVSESTSEESRVVDLRIRVRGERSMEVVGIRLLELLRRDPNASLMSMEVRIKIVESGSFTHIIMRLKIEGNEWDESAFLEAVRRLVFDLAP